MSMKVRWIKDFMPSCFCHCSICVHKASVRFPVEFYQSCRPCIVHGCLSKKIENSPQFIMNKWYKTRYWISCLCHYISQKIGPWEQDTKVRLAYNEEKKNATT